MNINLKYYKDMALQASEGKRSLPRKARSCGKFIIKNDYYKNFLVCSHFAWFDNSPNETRKRAIHHNWVIYYMTTKLIIGIYSIYHII